MKFVIFMKLIGESFRFALVALRMNMFRTILSLLGVTIGIFAIIGVFTVVDSLEKSIKESLNFLGTEVIYLEKWPFVPEGEEYAWWDYWRRPNASFSEYKFLEENLKNNKGIAIFGVRGGSILKRGSNSLGDVELRGGTYGYNDIFEVVLNEGRYFSRLESESGRNVAIIGSNLVNSMFPEGNPVGKEVKIRNLKFVVIGTMREEGESFLDTPSNDDVCVIPYGAFRKLYNTGTGAWNETASRIGVKGYETDIGLVELENEITGLMRNARGLKPREKNNFAINRPEAIANVIGGVFDVLTIAGWIIGGFSILVGGFGIANIMFVSVRERTNIIGIQKSLGAKNYFVLFQFLFESVFLSVIGGGVGLFLVFLLSMASLGTLELSLSFRNVLIGLGVASGVGAVAGIIPAVMAAWMDPVEAIRSN